MNERIKQLIEQCYETGPIGRDGWPEYSKLSEEKFAELIVRECIGFVYNYPEKYLTRNQSAEICMSMEEHFGVEA